MSIQVQEAASLALWSIAGLIMSWGIVLGMSFGIVLLPVGLILIFWLAMRGGKRGWGLLAFAIGAGLGATMALSLL